MTPSNANTSGLEVAAWRVWSVEGEDGLYYHHDVAVENAGESSFVEALVVAASAQARIDAAEARADRLAKALERIAITPSGMAGLSLSDCISEARAALQQETQQ